MLHSSKFGRPFRIRGVIAVLDHSGVKVYDAYGVEVQKERKTADWDMDAAEKGGYAHFMLKEIHEQPTAIKTTITPLH